VAAAGGVVRHEDVAGADDESLAVASGKFECASERDDILRFRCVVPVEARMWRRFLEVHGWGDEMDLGEIEPQPTSIFISEVELR